MKYASTIDNAGVKTVVVVLPLSQVPLFDPDTPPQANTYGVDDEVEVGWISDGSGQFVAPPPPAPVIPSRISKKQAKWHLVDLDLYDAVSAAISSMDIKAQIAWSDADYFDRTDPLIAGMQALLNMTNAEVDTFFVEANKL